MDHQPHYGDVDNPHETIKGIEATPGKAGYAAWLHGEILKYLGWLGKKGSPHTDAGKIRFYAVELERVLTPEKPVADLLKAWAGRNGEPRGDAAATTSDQPDGGKPDPVSAGGAGTTEAAGRRPISESAEQKRLILSFLVTLR